LKYVNKHRDDIDVSDDADGVEDAKEEFTNRGKGLGH